MRIVIDTNIIISAIGWAGKPQKVIEYCIDGHAQLLLSPEIIKEISDVLFRDKFSFIDVGKKNEFLMLLLELAEVIEPTISIDISKDTDDDKFIELAVGGNAKFIVSGDPHLLDIKEYIGIKILTAAEFLAIISSRKLN